MPERKGKVLAVRIAYGFGLILGLSGVFLIDGLTGRNWATTLAGVAVVGTGLWECYTLCERKGLRPWKLSASLAGAGLFLAQWVDLELGLAGPVALTETVFLAFFMVIALASVARKARSTVFEDLGTTFFGLIWVWFLLGFAFRLRNDPDLPGATGLWLTLMLVGTSKCGDIGAFFTGRFLGKHRLAPAVSPNKTLEGSIGGLLASVLFALCLSRVVPQCREFLTPAMALGFGATVGILSQAGDLFESLLKRSVHVKDSGAIIPEFGGVLDLLDGVLFAAPGAYFLVLLFK